MRSLALVVLALVAVFVPATAAGAPPPSDAFDALHWRMVGPFRGGRTRACAGVPGQPAVFYMAPVNGGVWKTRDAGRTWQPIFDGQPTQSIGSLAVAPSNPNIIYAGSGEGLLRPDLSVGNGVYKSTDAGKTWTHVGLADAQQIPQLAVDPRNPNRVYAAVLGHPYGPSRERGVFRSIDGGRTWDKVLYKNDNTGASDLAIDPTHPDVIYAGLWESRLGPWEDDNEYQGTSGGLFKSIDGGTTWKQLHGGLPANLVQVDVAIAPSRPATLYATLSTTEESHYGSGKGNGLYRSDDAGETWRSVTTDDRALMKIGGGDLMVPVVDPTNPEVVYVASIVAMKSRDGGKTWTWLRGAPGGDDYQNLWIDPHDPERIVLVADQGAVVTVDGGATWSSWYNQPTAQLYHVAVTADVPYRVCSGQQESGSVCIASRGIDGSIGERDWHPAAIIEYGYAAPDPRDPDVIYGAGRTEVSRYRWSTHQAQNVTPLVLRGTSRAERTQPIMFSPVRPDLLYYAANVVFSSTNGGQSWQTISPDLGHPDPGVPPSIGPLGANDHDHHRGAIYALAPSYKTTRTLWAGTDDGKLWTTRDGGAHWKDITPPAVTPWSKVTQLDASRFDDTTVYASVSRMRVDDLAPYIYRTHDAGKTWTAITSGLPAGPVNAVRADPVRKGLLYASTETGVFVSFDDGDTWQSLQRDLPHTSVRDLVVHGTDLIVATHGRGFWIMDDISPLRHVAAGMPTSLLPPAPALRLPRSEYPDTPIPPDEPLADNPPTGASLDYYLAAPANDVRLEIRDPKGQLVRAYASTDPPELTREQLANQLVPAYWVMPAQRLGTSPGMHRWIWDLRRARPRALAYGYPISAAPHATVRAPEGARVAPGTYTVKLVVDGRTFTTKVEVLLDPRLKLPAAVVARQNALETQLAELLDRDAGAALAARSVLDQLAALAPKDATLARRIAGLTPRITALLDAGEHAGPGPEVATLAGVAREVTALYASVQVDAAPTAAQLAAARVLEHEATALLARWSALEANDLAPLATALAAAKLPAIDPGKPPTTEQSNGNEE
ncbi:MAG: glycoside hydrolase [Kofleriaceae bacterium]